MCETIPSQGFDWAHYLWHLCVLWSHLASYPQPPLRRGHGCTVGIDRDPPVWPSTQAGWWRYQSASSYVRAYGLCVLRARGRVCGRWFCGVSAVDSRTLPRTMSLALSFDLGCQVSNLCSQQQPNALLLAMLLSSLSWTPTGSVDSASFSSAGSSVSSLVRTLVLDDLNWWFQPLALSSSLPWATPPGS